MQALIIFDVDHGTEEVTTKLRNMGYYTTWITSNTKERYYLPRNAVWKPDVELNVALKDIQNIIRELNNIGRNIALQRCIVISANPWDGISGSPP